jgi:hypothetical protein
VLKKTQYTPTISGLKKKYKKIKKKTLKSKAEKDTKLKKIQNNRLKRKRCG